VKRPQRNPRPSKADHVSAAVKRAVWARDGGKCQWPVDGGGVCGSTTRLEIDHVVPRGKGGQSTVTNCRLTCKAHNLEAARVVYGEEVMGRYVKNPVASENCAGGFSRSLQRSVKHIRGRGEGQRLPGPFVEAARHPVQV
jgi:5-methylcytosine-specific restriction endonuclease McrA